MSLDKAIAHGKEFRKPYFKRGSAADRSCRPGGGCPYCAANRKHSTRKKYDSAKDSENESLD